jgi:hypothetical protein
LLGSIEVDELFRHPPTTILSLRSAMRLGRLVVGTVQEAPPEVVGLGGFIELPIQKQHQPACLYL